MIQPVHTWVAICLYCSTLACAFGTNTHKYNWETRICVQLLYIFSLYIVCKCVTCNINVVCISSQTQKVEKAEGKSEKCSPDHDEIAPAITAASSKPQEEQTTCFTCSFFACILLAITHTFTIKDSHTRPSLLQDVILLVEQLHLPFFCSNLEIILASGTLCNGNVTFAVCKPKVTLLLMLMFISLY